MSDLGDKLDRLVALAVEEVPGPYCLASVVGGAQADSMYAMRGDGNCGSMLWARLITANRSTSFPSPSTANDCAGTLAFPVELGIARQAPQILQSSGRNAVLPSQAEVRAAADKQHEDMLGMYRAIKRFQDEVEDINIGPYTPFGPEGDLIGGAWTVTFGIE